MPAFSCTSSQSVLNGLLLLTPMNICYNDLDFVYAYTVLDARRRAAQRALEALMKKQPSHVNSFEESSFYFLEFDYRLLPVNQWLP